MGVEKEDFILFLIGVPYNIDENIFPFDPLPCFVLASFDDPALP